MPSQVAERKNRLARVRPLMVLASNKGDAVMATSLSAVFNTGFGSQFFSDGGKAWRIYFLVRKGGGFLSIHKTYR
jgi:hypothetical protein